MLANRISSTEELVRGNLSAIEQKFGQQDSFIADNIVDMTQVNKLFSDINTRILEIEERISALETDKPEAKPDTKKKKGTVKLDLHESAPSFS